MFRRSVAILLAILLLPVGIVPRRVSAQPPTPDTATPPARRPPELVEFVEAPYPEAERASGRSAAVVLSITIAADGSVEDASVVESAGPAFDEAALAAARRFRFSPAIVDGVPTRSRIQYRYDFVLRVEAPTTAELAGVVRNGDSRQPIEGVRVTLDDGRATTTDAEGRFEFTEVTPGAHTFTIEGERLTTSSLEETLVAGERLEASYSVFLEAPPAEGELTDDIEIVVQAPPVRTESVSTQVTAEDARRVAGTGGEVLLVVQNLPGVARQAAGSGALVVWGASPEDTNVYIDGVRVPRLYHDGGLRSVVASDFIRSVELVPGGYGATYGRGLGGLVVVGTRDADANAGVHGSVGFDLYDASASLRFRTRRDDAAEARGDTYGAFGARIGYVGNLLAATVSSDIEDYFPLPNYIDAQARVGVVLRPGETVDATVLVSSDRISRNVQSPDPSRSTRETRDLLFHRTYLRYRRDLGDGSVAQAVLFAGTDAQGLESDFGTIRTSLNVDSVSFGLRASYRSRVASWLTLEGGLDAEAVYARVTREGALSAPPREGDIRVFGQPPPDQIASDRYNTTTIGVAPYVEADLALAADRLHVVAGLRVDPYARSQDRANPGATNLPTGLFRQDIMAEPRIAVRYAPSERFATNLAFGSYRQAPRATDLSSTFGNPRLPTSRAYHGVLGFNIRPTTAFGLELTTFLTQSYDIAMRSRAESPLATQALLPTGRGRAYGAQLLARLDQTEASRFYGWVSYSLVKSERRDAPGAGWRPFDYDQRHVLTALGGVRLPLDFDVGMRARLATGYPRTEVVDAYYDARRDLYQPIFGQHNQLRIPIFFQLDLRVSKTFDIGETELELSLDLQNITNRRNAEELIYDERYTERGKISGLPFIPVLGLRWSL